MHSLITIYKLLRIPLSILERRNNFVWGNVHKRRSPLSSIQFFKYKQSNKQIEANLREIKFGETKN